MFVFCAGGAGLHLTPVKNADPPNYPPVRNDEAAPATPPEAPFEMLPGASLSV
jgi:hypothetical protein